MKREEYIKQCKYYKGEKECPFGGKGCISDELYKNNNRAYWWNVERSLYDHFSGTLSPALAIDCFIKKGIEGGLYGESNYLQSYASGEFKGSEN